MPDPDPGIHMGSAYIKDVASSLPTRSKLLISLNLAEKFGYDKVNIHIEGKIRDRKVSNLENWIKKLWLKEFGGNLKLLKEVSGEVLLHHNIRRVEEFKKYLSEFERVAYFSLRFGDGYHCVRCSGSGLQIGGNENEVTILYNGKKYEQITEEIAPLFK